MYAKFEEEFDLINLCGCCTIGWPALSNIIKSEEIFCALESWRVIGDPDERDIYDIVFNFAEREKEKT